MAYITKGGYVLTEEMIEELANQAEKGIYPGENVEVIIAPSGRSPLCDEESAAMA